MNLQNSRGVFRNHQVIILQINNYKKVHSDIELTLFDCFAQYKINNTLCVLFELKLSGFNIMLVYAYVSCKMSLI